MASALPLILLLCLAVGQLDGFFLKIPHVKLPCIRLHHFKVFCPHPVRPVWTRYGSRYFIVQPKRLTMADAELNCIRLGGNLASIHNYHEHLWIRGQVRRVLRSYKRTWIGLFDAVQERKWMWTDGSRVRFTRWGRGMPNNFRRRQDCTYINFRGAYWNDLSCTARLPSVCVRRR